MTIQWRDRVIENPPPVSDEQVDKVEQAIGWRFPQDYLRVVRINQGRKPQPDCFELANGDSSVISYLLVVEEHHFQYLPGLMWLMAGGRFPESGPSFIVPFAADPGESLICFDYRAGPENPAVVFWDHEANAKRSPQTIAASFTDLLEKLYEADD